jgi:hypothetical protein
MPDSPPPQTLLRCMDCSDPEDIAGFEQGFYLGFEESTHNKIIRWLWIWDEQAHRLRTRVPYEDQTIWISASGSPPDTGIAVNTRMALLQSSAFGFSLPDTLSGSGNTCEFLTAFSTGDRSIGHFHKAWNEVFHTLQALGFRNAVATCARKILPLYRRMGAVILEERLIEEQVRYFLGFELFRTARWNARLDEAAPLAPLAVSPAEALSAAQGELGILLHRLLPLLDIARGNPDRSFSPEVRSEGARRVIDAARQRLRISEQDPQLSAASIRCLLQLDLLSALWSDIVPLAGLTSGHPSTDALGMVESLEMMMLTAADAWDGDRDAAETIALLTASDRSRVLGDIVSKAREAGHDPERLAAAAQRFAGAVRTLHTLASTLQATAGTTSKSRTGL